jgi:hypothetical protein
MKRNINFHSRTSTTGLKVSSSNVKKLLFKSLQTSKWDDGYPQDSVPFYLFGKSHELHIEHKIVRSPNIQLSAGNIEHSFGSELFKDEYERPLFLVIKGPYGNPFRPGSNFAESNTFGFKLGESFDAEVYESEDSTIPLCSGKIELKKGKTVVFTDKHRLNRNPLSSVISDEERRGKWSKEVDKQLGRF